MNRRADSCFLYSAPTPGCLVLRAARDATRAAYGLFPRHALSGLPNLDHQVGISAVSFRTLAVISVAAACSLGPFVYQARPLPPALRTPTHTHQQSTCLSITVPP